MSQGLQGKKTSYYFNKITEGTEKSRGDGLDGDECIPKLSEGGWTGHLTEMPHNPWTPQMKGAAEGSR